MLIRLRANVSPSAIGTRLMCTRVSVCSALLNARMARVSVSWQDASITLPVLYRVIINFTADLGNLEPPQFMNGFRCFFDRFVDGIFDAIY
jgi:hypothetical protein